MIWVIDARLTPALSRQARALASPNSSSRQRRDHWSARAPSLQHHPLSQEERDRVRGVPSLDYEVAQDNQRNSRLAQPDPFARGRPAARH